MNTLFKSIYLCAACLFVLASANAQNYNLEDFINPDEELQSKADSLTSELSIEALAGQMIVSSGGELGKPIAHVSQLVKEGKLGGVILLKGQKETHRAQLAMLQKTSKDAGHLPLVFSSDSEPTLVNGRLKGIPPVKKTNAITDSADSWLVARQITKELKDLGFHQNFAPVVDVAKNSAFITSRSYGDDEKRVVKLSAAFIDGTQSDGIIATAKHFPGHGYVQGDTHKESVYIDGELKELSVYPPLIDAGVASIMIAHMTVRNNEKWGTNGLPASCSREIVTDLLKGELGFKGLVITDALGMQAVAKIPDGDMLAARAGNDMLLMPADENELHAKLIAEMNKDATFKAQVMESVSKIIRLKICLGLI